MADDFCLYSSSSSKGSPIPVALVSILSGSLTLGVKSGTSGPSYLWLAINLDIFMWDNVLAEVFRSNSGVSELPEMTDVTLFVLMIGHKTSSWWDFDMAFYYLLFYQNLEHIVVEFFPFFSPFLRMHNVWKLLKMSHLNFWHFSIFHQFLSY